MSPSPAFYKHKDRKNKNYLTRHSFNSFKIDDNHSAKSINIHHFCIKESVYTTANDEARTAFNTRLTSAQGTELASYFYWSSSELNSNNSWCVFFGSGYASYGSKTNHNRVRCVREF